MVGRAGRKRDLSPVTWSLLVSVHADVQSRVATPPPPSPTSICTGSPIVSKLQGGILYVKLPGETWRTPYKPDLHAGQTAPSSSGVMT